MHHRSQKPLSVSCMFLHLSLCSVHCGGYGSCGFVIYLSRMNHGSGETRYRQTGDGEDELQDELLIDQKARKSQPKKIGQVFEKLLTTALFFAFLVLFFWTSFDSKIVLAAKPPLRLEKQKLILSKQERDAKFLPSSDDDRVLKWLQASKKFRLLKETKRGSLEVGLINFFKPDILKWKHFSGGQKPTVFNLDKELGKQNLTWSDFFPEHIDRNEEVQSAKCPRMPLPSVQVNLTLDIVIASIPCDKSEKNWSRDINSFQAFLAAAKVAANTDSESMHVVLSGNCRPPLNIFKCKELLEHHSGIWMYKVNLDRIRTLLTLPAGSCMLAGPLKTTGEHDVSREAYATILHSIESYVCGAIGLAHSIRKTGSIRDLVLLADEHVRPEDKQGLESAGWKVWTIERIRNPKATPSSYNEWNYSKLRLWQLTQYDKLIYIDADIAVLRNMDFLFEFPEIAAVRNHQNLFNSGVMVIEPSNCTFELLLDSIDKVESYNGGDQGFLNEIFTWWHRLPETLNFLKHFDNDIEENKRKVELFTADPPVLYAMHFLGVKPWLCFRDYDCNWNYNGLQVFANDAVHTRWWKLHDTMPENLQQYCLQQSKRKGGLERRRREATMDMEGPPGTDPD